MTQQLTPLQQSILTFLLIWMSCTMYRILTSTVQHLVHSSAEQMHSEAISYSLLFADCSVNHGLNTMFRHTVTASMSDQTLSHRSSACHIFRKLLSCSTTFRALATIHL